MKRSYRNLVEQLNLESDPALYSKCTMPNRKQVVKMLKIAQEILMPELYQYDVLELEDRLAHFADLLEEEISAVFCYLKKDCSHSTDLTDKILQKLPELKRLILLDVQAIYDGDPAALSKVEVMISYPGFYAIWIYRLAHILYQLEIPLLPRIMTEYAHEKTGIDIHPGATIGSHFCIDHGTGIVIGETAVIGHHVKLYQGVTLGARSFELDEQGHPVKGGKRHPNIGDYVVIYANATILGGDTVIGNHAVIGGNVWIMESVAEGEKRYYTQK